MIKRDNIFSLPRVMPDIKVSVIVCTYNRCALVRESILSLLEQDIAKNSYEIIVVDNNSTDNTKYVVEEISKGEMPVLKYIKEDRQGLSYARNRGAREASGEIVAYIDDDAIAEKGWLKGLLDVYRNFPDAGIVGGRIDPVWLHEKPSWITKNIEVAYTILNYGNEIKEISFPKTPFGANLSVKRDVFLSLGGFSTQLGRKAASLISNEELYLCYLVEQNDKKLYYTPNAVVHHKVFPERLNRRFLFKRAYAQGISNILLERELKQNQGVSWSNDLKDLKKVMKGSVRHFLSGNNELVTEDLFTIFLIFGKLRKRFV